MNLSDFKSGKIINEISQKTYSWDSPSNIALVKYWGKNLDQTPKNPSISLTLSNCKTTTKVEFVKSGLKSDSVNFEIIFEGQKNCLLYTSPSPRDRQKSRMPSSA